MKLSTLFGKPKPKPYFPKEIAMSSDMVEDLNPYWRARDQLVYMKLSDTTNTLEKSDIKTVRVEVYKDGVVSVICFDMLGHPLEGTWDSTDDLPIRIQRKISVLMIGGGDRIGDEVKNVGIRVAENVFWVYDMEDEIGEKLKSN